jgi:putative tryptophan/tyrosine transport system substrate-binding protein
MKKAAPSILIAVVLLAVGVITEAQQPAKVPRIGMLMPVSPAAAASNIDAFRQGLRDNGWVGGQNIAVETRYSERAEWLPDLAAELVQLKVDVIVTWGTPAARAAKKATSTIPIVMAAAIDPVETGLVSSLARPGGNLTGLSSGGSELSGKALELLKEIVPRVARMAVVWNPDNPAEKVKVKETQAAAQALGVRLQSLEARAPNELESAFVAMKKERAGALLVQHEQVFLTHSKLIVELAATNRLPAMYERREYVDVGGLMSYGVSFPENFRRAATYVDKILKGAKPADLPVEQPKKFEFIINLKAAKQIGLIVPPNVLARADKVIR